MDTTTSHIAVGRIARSRGLQGEMAVFPLSDDPERFESFQTVFLGDETRVGEAYEVERALIRSSKGKPVVHLRLRGVNDRDASDHLRGRFVYVTEDELPLEEDEYFLFQLVGTSVVDDEGNLVGRIADIQRLPAHDIFVIERENGSVMVPDVPEFVDKTELEEGRITIRPIEGLLD